MKATETTLNPFGRFRESVIDGITTAATSLGISTLPETIIQDTPSEWADLAVLGFPFAELFETSPNQAAERLSEALQEATRQSGIAFVERWETKGPYINFFVDVPALNRLTLTSIISLGSEYGNAPPQGIRIILEHTSANPSGPFHVGRARNPLIGDSLARVLRRAGYNLEVQYWVNDMGKQAAMLSWSLRNISEKDLPPSERDKADHRLVRYYQEASQRMDADMKVAKEIEDLLGACERGEGEAFNRVRNDCSRVLDGMKETLSRLNVQVDQFIFESESVEDGSVMELIETLRKVPQAGVEDGADYLDLKEFGIHARDAKIFFTRQAGTSLYITRDLAYHLRKLRESDLAINILGEDHKLESEQLRIGLQLMGQKKTPEVLFYAFVSLPEGKMSTRRGRLVTFDDLLDEAKRRATEEVTKRRDDLPKDKVDAIAESIGMGAVRYNIVRVQPEKKIVFRWEEALNFEGSSAPFIQYAHARAASILRKSNGSTPKGYDAGLLREPSEIRLIKLMSQFPDKIFECARTRRVHPVANYAFNLAQEFNQFYRDSPVLDAGTDSLRAARIALVHAAKQVLGNSLDTLGIQPLEEM